MWSNFAPKIRHKICMDLVHRCQSAIGFLIHDKALSKRSRRNDRDQCLHRFRYYKAEMKC